MNINTRIKHKQYLWLGVIVTGLTTTAGTGWYLSEIELRSSQSNQHGGNEPAPDMTGVVDASFDTKVQQHATTEMQVTQSTMNKRFEQIQREISLLSKQRADDLRRLEEQGQENAVLKARLIELARDQRDEPVPVPPATPPGTEGEPQPAMFPPTGLNESVPPPTAFYPGNDFRQPPVVSYRPIPVPNQISRSEFNYENTHISSALPYIPSGSFAKSMLIEGADTNASVTGNESTVPMQLRIIGHVEMPNSKTYDLTGCFVGLEAWGDVSSERAIVRTRKISCIRGKDVIDQAIAGHVSFMGKNGIKGEVVMRNGKVLGWVTFPLKTVQG